MAERTRKTEISWAARMKEAATVSKVSSLLKSDNLGGKACTFFFTNFPEFWETTGLWQEFRRIGTVVDVFVARKRNKTGRKFGFVRFLKVQDVGKMEQELNNLWMNKFKLKANVAKYGRKDIKENPQNLKSVIIGPAHPVSEKPEASRDGARRGERSYVDAVNGSFPLPPPPSVKNDGKDQEINSVHVIPSTETLERLDRSLFGEVRCLEMLKNIHEFPTVEGLNDVKVSYYGGLTVLLEFRSKIAAKNYLILARSTWFKWFRDLDCWSPEEQPMKRFAYLNIVGLPPHAWVPNVFSDIGAMWGDVVIPEWCRDESQNRERGRVIILTQVFSIINNTVDIIVNNTRFKIMVVEDFKESEKVGPKFPHYSSNQEEKDEEDKVIDREQSLCDENSDFGFDREDLQLHGEDEDHHDPADVDDGEDEDDHDHDPADADTGEDEDEHDPADVDTGEGSPEVEITGNNGYLNNASFPVQDEIEDYSSMQACGAVPNSTIKIKNFSTHVQHSRSKSGPRSKSGSSMGFSFNSNSLGSLGPSLESQNSSNQQTSSPPQIIKETADISVNENLFHEDPTIKIKTSIIIPTPTIDLSPNHDDFIAEETEKLIDMEEDEMDASSRFWENKANRLKKVKKDLKMRKIHSPCNCRVKIKRNGDGCKHAMLSGNVMNNTIIVDRDEEGGSDSEIFIKSSNTRILKEDSAPVAKSRESLIADEVLKLDEVGTAIGVDIHGYHDQMKEMETKSDKLRDFDANALWGSNKNCWAASPSLGNSGGLISIWDPSFIEIDKIETNRRTVTILSKWKDLNQDMGVINVYAPQDEEGKQDLWNWISNAINNDCDRMWIICGDFNEVRCTEERRGSTFYPRGAQIFNSFIENLGLIDLNLGGRSFTYVSPNGANSSRLDRFLVTPNCITKWPNVSNIALLRLFSDHCPIMLESNGPDFGAAPFKFFSSWLKDPDCEQVFQESWSKDGPNLCLHSKTERPHRVHAILFEIPIPAVPVIIKKHNLVDVNSHLSKVPIQVADYPPSGRPALSR
ncbi:hypothetical protein LXL04_038169 [Taraxacum kok-saghyz]